MVLVIYIQSYLMLMENNYLYLFDWHQVIIMPKLFMLLNHLIQDLALVFTFLTEPPYR